MQPRQWIAIGAFWAGLGVAMGAFGAHALKEKLDAADQLASFQVAVRYQVWHALALISFGLVGLRNGSRPALVGWAFLVGSFLFSGSLYCLTLGVLRPVMGPVTPLGGLFLMIGWATWGITLLRRKTEDR